MPRKDRSIYTLAVQAGSRAVPGSAVPAVPPIVPAVGFIHPTMHDADEALGYTGGTPFDPARYVYSRYGAPNQGQLEEAVAALEGAEGAVSFSSGMAALHAVLLAVVPPGGVVVAAEQLYGATRTLLTWLAVNLGVYVHYVDFLDRDAIRQTVAQHHPSAVLCEVVTNPLCRVVDLDVARLATRETGAALVVDNTFATPYLIQPLALGADIVVHSTTKFLNGHGDVLGGIAAGPSDLMQHIYEFRKVLGAMPGAFDAWLTLRGLRTLAVRMQQSCASAMTLATWLAEQPWIKRVYYPGLQYDPVHETARRLFDHDSFGSVMAFEIRDFGRSEAFAFVDALRLIRPVTSLGDIYSLILHPASASHRALTPEQRESVGITDGLLRLSVGIEDPADLAGDLAQAFAAVTGHSGG